MKRTAEPSKASNRFAELEAITDLSGLIAQRHALDKRAAQIPELIAQAYTELEQVDVEATHVKMLKHRKGGSPLTGVRVSGVLLGPGSSSEMKAMQTGESPDQAAERIIAAIGPNMNFEEARRVKENYLALKAQLEYDRDSGIVVLVDDVAKAVGEEYAKTRTKLLSIPSNLAPQLLRIKTASEMCAALESAITEALSELTLAANAE